SNVVPGGAAGDAIYAGVHDVHADGTYTAGTGTNLVFGDGGAIQWSSDGSYIDSAVSTFTDLALVDPAFGGVDTIKLGNGANLVVGGAAGDAITAGTGTSVIIGDNGEIHSPGNNANPFGPGLDLTLDTISTLVDGVGGVDTIKTGNGNAVVLGGAAGDTIWASATVAADGTIAR